MGYNLYITKAESWFDNTGNEISTEDWFAYVRKSTELQLDEQNDPCHTIWNNNEEYWLDLSGGNIFTKNPSETFIKKLVKIANDLDAKVQGEDGEVYKESGKAIYPKQIVIYCGSFVKLNILRGINLFRKLLLMREIRLKRPFEIGDKVIDYWGQLGTVIGYRFEQGLDLIDVEMEFGRIDTHYVIGLSLKNAAKSNKKNV